MKMQALSLEAAGVEVIAEGSKTRVKNLNSESIALENLEVRRWKLPEGERVFFQRFGMNMPGDAVFFGSVGKSGFFPEILPYEISPTMILENESGYQVSSNSLMLLRSAENSEETLLVGAGSYRLTEGTIKLFCDRESGEIFLSYRMILDGLTLKPGEEKELDDIYIASGSDYNKLLADWADHHAAMRKAIMPKQIPTGWNDWQFYRNEKTQEHILDSLEGLEKLRLMGFPLDFLQIDGGFCVHLSEWSMPKPEFCMGIKAVSERVRAAGLKFGLWFAPYIQNKETIIAKEHPEWFLRDEKGEIVELAGSNVGAALLIDYSHREAEAWLRKQLRLFLDEWQVTWIKLDGPNYALYRRGRLADNSWTIHQMLQRTFDIIREEADPEVIIEGEGPMGLALGYAELHRVQNDNHPIWYHLQNPKSPIITKVYGKELLMGFLHNRWWCNHRENVILRDYASPYAASMDETEGGHLEQQFTLHEHQFQLASAIMSPGGLLLTDPLLELLRHPDQIKMAAALLPPADGNPEIIDPFPPGMRYSACYRMKQCCGDEQFTLLGVFNWRDFSFDFSLPFSEITGENSGEWHICSYFGQERRTVDTGKLEIIALSAHAAELYAIHRAEKRPQLIGSNIHMTMGGTEIAENHWDENAKCLSIKVNHFYQQDAKLFFAMPRNFSFKRIESSFAKWVWNDLDDDFPVLEYRSNSSESEIKIFFE